ncbi:MAG: hypothetical protein RLZZ84_2011 [Pseudomonadota bacterium]|jgi:hypothetical protein
MKRFLIAALALLAAPLSAQTLANPVLPEWLAGIWVMEDGAQWSDTLWTDPRGGMMLGVSRNGFGSQMQGWEVVQIRQKGDGHISFFAQPQGRLPVEFPLVLISAEAIEFANPANDYPQRIRYWRQGKLLMAEMSRLDGSDTMRWNFRPVVPPQDD